VGRIVRSETPSAAAWAPCAACWGQGRIYCRGDDRRLYPVPCYGCLGVGQTLPVPADLTGPEGFRGPPV
jgi:hypothetical protein